MILNRKFHQGVLAIFVIALLGGCGHYQVPFSFVDEPLPMTARTLPPREIGNRIHRAIAPRGWRCVQSTPDRLTCSLDKKNRWVEIDISYTNFIYSLHLLHSRNMRSDGMRIHKLYNKWIKTLMRDIKQNF